MSAEREPVSRFVISCGSLLREAAGQVIASATSRRRLEREVADIVLEVMDRISRVQGMGETALACLDQIASYRGVDPAAIAHERGELRHLLRTSQMLARTCAQLLDECSRRGAANGARLQHMRAEAQAWRRRIAGAEVAVETRYALLAHSRQVFTLEETQEP